jgi:glycosyltransferase involved in cell wall biosynthesis
MKILQLGKAFAPVKGIGGVEKVIELFYYGLNRNHIDCDVLGVNDKFKFEIDNFSYNGKIYRERLLLRAQSTFLSVHLIIRLFRISHKYDIIHVHHPDPMSFLALFLVRPRAKIVIHWHSDILRQKFLYFFFKKLEKWVLRRSDLILCTSPKYFESNLILEPYLKKVDYLAIGFNKVDNIVNKNLVSSIELRKGNRKQIVFIGRLVYYKGLEFLIKSMSITKSDAYLCIIGDGEYFNALKQLTKDLGIENKVFYFGNLKDSDKFSYLMTSDILVLPSIFKSEAYGIVQIEAMAYGIPVVSTRIVGSGVDWVNQNGRTGITVPICDEHALAKAIDQICFDSMLYQKLSNGAIRRYQHEFTEDTMISRLMKFYEKILM